MGLNITGSDGSLYWEAGMDDAPLDQAVKNIERRFNSLTSTVGKSGNEMDDVFKRAATAAAGFFSLQAGVGLINQIKNVRSEYQQLEASYATILGSKQKADALMAETIKFAATTPFGLSEVAQGTKLLLAYGLSAKEATSSLRSIGDIAASINQPINELAMVYGQIRTQGRLYTEDLNQLTGRGVPIIKALADQFHVAEDRVKGLVEAGQVGFPEIQKAFTAMTTGAGLFTGAMEAQSKTLAGQISNLEDALDQVYNKIGKENEETFSAAIKGANDLVNNYEVLLNALEAIVAGYTAYKAAAIIDYAYTNAAARVGAIIAEKDAVTALAIEKSRAAAQELITATQLKAAAVDKYRTDAAALLIAQEKLAMAEAENLAAQSNIYAQNKLTASKELQIATDRVTAAQETTALSRKAALAATTNLHMKQLAAETLAKEAGTLATTEMTAAEALATAGTNLLSSAWARLSAFMAANPFLLVAAAAAGLFYTFKTLNDEQEKLSITTEGYLGELESERGKLKEATEYAKRLTAGTKERNDAIKDINDKYGAYLTNLLTETSTNKDLADAYELINQKIKDNIDLKFQQKNQDKARTNYEERADPAYENLLNEIRTTKGPAAVGQARAEIDGIVDRLTKLYEKRQQLLDQGKDMGDITAQMLNITQGFYKRFDINQGLFDNKFGQLAEIAAARVDLNKVNADNQKMFGKAPVTNGPENGKIAPVVYDAAYYDKIIKDTKTAIEALDKTQADFAQKKTGLDKILLQAQKDRRAFDTETLATRTKAEDEALKKRQDLYSQFGQLHQDYLQNQKAADQKEIDQTVYKYDHLLKKAAEYNATHKVKVNPAALNLDASGNIVDKPVAGGRTLDINAEKVSAKNDVLAKQQLEKDKVQYEAQKELYAQYEEYKTKFGSKAADERFANELKGATNYVQYLEKLEQDNKGETGAYASKLTEFLEKELITARVNEAKQNFEFLNTVLSDTQTYEQKLIVLKQNYERVALAAALNGNEANVKIAKESYEQQVEGLNESHAQRIAVIQKYNEHVIQLTRTQAENQLKTLKEIQAASNLTPEQNNQIDEEAGRLTAALTSLNGLSKMYTADLQDQKLKLQEQLQVLTPYSEKWKEIFDKIAGINALLDRKVEPDQFGQTVLGNETSKKAEKVAAYSRQIQSSFNELSASIAPFNEGLADTLSTIGDIAGVAGNAASSVAKFASGDIVGGIASGISAIAGVFGIFGKAKESARKAAAEIAKYNDDMIKGEFALNQLLRERARSQADINKLTSEELKARQQMLTLQSSQAKNDYSRLLSLIQGSGQQITGEHTEKYGGFLGIGRKTKVVQELAGLSGSDYDALERLYTQGKLTETTKAWFEELKKAHDELDSIGQSAEEAVLQLNRIATGTTAADIAKAISDGFKSGKRSVADFMDYFDEMLQNGLLSKFENDFLKGKIDEFYKQYSEAATSDGGLTSDKIAALREAYAGVIESAGKELENIQKVTGTSLSGTNSSNSLKGSIQAQLTEQTGSVLAGAFNGQRLATLEILGINKEQLALARADSDRISSFNLKILSDNSKKLELLNSININTGRTADNTETTNEKLEKVNKSIEALTKATAAASNTLAANGKI